MRGMNQGQLAASAQLSQSALSRFENGQTLPDAYELRALAVALGYKQPADLIARIEEAFTRTQDAAKKVSPGSPGAPWANIAAGVLAGLALVGVATMLDEANKKKAPKKA
jgi:transcriptional regulator with XRE-family HTH domain